jgi:TnsA endonuclease N terminal
VTKYAQGRFQLQHPEKYVGKNVPKYRSSWEFAVMSMCDNHPSIIQWANEAIRINYRNPFTGKSTIYVPDFFVMFEDANGHKQGEIWEIKPSKETSLDEARSTRDQAAAILNMAKWQAAQAWCNAQNLRFRIVTEKDLYDQRVGRK